MLLEIVEGHDPRLSSQTVSFQPCDGDVISA